MSLNVPSRWAFPDDENVLIVPIKIGDAYFTAVIGAPDDWNNNLIVSGFRQSSEGWVKRGLANEYELGYLSESVTISDVDDSFFFDYFNPVDDVAPEFAIPSEVAEAINWLSLQGRKALAFELSIVLPDVTDVVVSSYLERALGGEIDEHVDIVYELAVERIKSQLSGAELSKSVIQFAKEKAINLVVQSDDVLTPKGSVLLPRGERVSWDESGVKQYGRVSRQLKVGDDGCWLHSLPVAWVGGYPSPREIWVDAEALGFPVEPLPSDGLELSVDSEYEAAREFLSSVKVESVREIASRIYMSIPEDLVPSLDGRHKEVWLSNGKLWVDDTFFQGWGFDSKDSECIELSDGLCHLEQGDRDLIRDIDNAISVIDRANFGDDCFERVTLTFSGQHLKPNVHVTAQYGLSGLFGNALFMRRSNSAESLREADDAVGLQSLLESIEGFHRRFARKVESVKSFMPKSDSGTYIVDASFVKHSMSGAVHNSIAYTRFKDRVITLGLEADLPDDLAFRVMATNVNSVSDRILDVTPLALRKHMNGPSKEFSIRADGRLTDYSYSSGKGFHIYKLKLGWPVLIGDVFSKLLRDDVEVNLPQEYFAAGGSTAGRDNSLMIGKKEEYGIPSVYLVSTSSSDEVVFSEAEFKSGQEHLGEETLRFQGFLKDVGVFDNPRAEDEKPVFSSQLHDLWGESAERIVDILKVNGAVSAASKLPRSAVKEFVDAEVTRKLTAMFVKAQFGEDTIAGIKNGIAESVLEFIDQGSTNRYTGHMKTDDVIAFSVARTSRNIQWRSIKFDTIDARTDKAIDWMREPRAAVIDSRVSEGFGRTRGVKLHIDILSLVYPELAGKLYMLGESASQLVGESKVDMDGYQDTGVVTGYAIKDLRAMSIDSLLVATANMSSSQRDKYVKKELYFPRPDPAVLQQLGCSPQAALFLDMVWVGLPSRPFSTLSGDIDTYGRLMSEARSGSDEFMVESKHLLSETVLGAEFMEGFDEAISSGTASIIKGLDYDKRRFMNKSSKLKGSNFMTSFGMDSSYTYRDGKRSHCEDAARYFNNSKVRKGGELVRVSDITWDHLLPKKQKAASATVKTKMSPDIRTGEDYRDGRVVDSEDFIKTFGFSGVEFGNWTNQVEREAHINLSYDSMRDFSKLLECEPMALSLGGRLGLCFGSRGRGGKNPASAHYEPSNMAINLTRRSGVGSLAHEYFHAIAGHYGEVESGVKGADYSEKVGNLLSHAMDKDEFSFTPLMREELQSTFRDLMRSIMYKPSEGQDEKDISNYTEKSEVYLGSADLDKASRGTGRLYWSLPHEMFARSMEVWVGVELAKKDYRNDYLVSSGKVEMNSAVYPSVDHMKRITMFADKWVGSLRTELKQVQHPYLGEIKMPIFHSKNRAVQPLNQVALEGFAHSEMKVLFGKIKPMLAVKVGGMAASAGSYDLMKDLITLNSEIADKSVFYHEAWHVCQAKLLSNDEKDLIASVFSDETVKALITDAMRNNKFTDESVNAALADPVELEAYAFELWAQGELSLAERPVKTIFGVVKEVSDSAAAISDTLDFSGLKRVEEIFERFYGGELALDRAVTVEVESFDSRGEPRASRPKVHAITM